MSKWFEPIVKIKKGFWPTCNGCWNHLKKTNEQAIAKKKDFFFTLVTEALMAELKAKLIFKSIKNLLICTEFFIKKLALF
jgi:hypothetical protein